MPELQMPEAEIRARWERGLSVNAIAKSLGVAHATVKSRAEAMGLPPRLPGARPEGKVARLIEAWSDGVPVIEIAQELGLCAESVRIWARDYGLPRRPQGSPGKVTQADKDALRRMWAEGLSCRRIAQDLGVSLSTVSHWARKLELPVPNPAYLAAGGCDVTGGRGRGGPALTEADVPRVLARLREGVARKRLAKELGVADGTLRAFVARHGLPPAVPAPDRIAPAEAAVADAPVPAAARLPRVKMARVVAAAPVAPAPELPPFDADLAKALTWADVAVVARRHGKPLVLAQSRWHRLRGQVAA